MDTAILIIVLAIIIFALVTVSRSVRVVPEASAFVIERLGKYSKTLYPGLHFLVPFIDRVHARVNRREQVYSFPPQAVITSDNLVVSIDTVVYFKVTEPRDAVYAIQNYLTGIEQLTTTTLRNLIGTMDLEQTLTSRDQINGQLRGVLDDATGQWGIRVGRVELKAIDPPPSVQDSMEKQMRAERDRRATILTAEGVKQSQVLTAEGEKQAQILRAEGAAQAAILESQGQARAILQVFDAIHRGNADSRLLAYQYLRVLPEIANGSASKLWMIPSDLTSALSNIGGALSGASGSGSSPDKEPEAHSSGVDWPTSDNPHYSDVFEASTLVDPNEALRQARSAADIASAQALQTGQETGVPFDPAVEAGQRPGLPAPTPQMPTAPEQAPPSYQPVHPENQTPYPDGQNPQWQQSPPQQ